MSNDENAAAKTEEPTATPSEGGEITDITPTEGKEGAEGTEGAETAPKKSPLKLILFIGVPVLILGIAAGVLFLTHFGRVLIGLEKAPKKEITQTLPDHITYYELPEMLVNIQSTSKRKPYLRVAIKLELHQTDATPTLDLIKPRIIDSFQMYIRELRVDDLEGSAGSQRLKQELLKRVNALSAPIKIHDVLFGVFVIQ